MANTRTTADLVDKILRRAGELTNGNSSYEADALTYLNQVYQDIIAGGSEIDPEVDEYWTWARRKQPIKIDLQAKVEDTVTFTNGANSLTFATSQANSLEGYFIKVDNEDEWYRIADHESGTGGELGSNYLGTTGAKAAKCVKLDYELVDNYITIKAGINDSLQFQETSGSTLTSTLTDGVYSPSELATEIDTQLTADGASAYTVTYSSVTRKITIASDGAGGGGILSLMFGSGSNAALSNASFDLGFTRKDLTGALTYTSDLPVNGAISKMVSPATVFKGLDKSGQIHGMGITAFQEEFPMTYLTEGVPTHFSVLEHGIDGTVKLRFNRYPENETRVEFELIEIPFDLVDNAASIPVVPRPFLPVLEYLAAGLLLIDKNDDKAQSILSLGRQKLTALSKQHRKQFQSMDKFYGQIIARRDMSSRQRRLVDVWNRNPYGS